MNGRGFSTWYTGCNLKVYYHLFIPSQNPVQIRDIVTVVVKRDR